jgi:hypothetical protein
MPDWVSIAKTLGRDRAVFLIPEHSGKGLAEAKNYLSNQLRDFSLVAIDPNVMNRFHMVELPRTILVGKDGRVQRIWRERITVDGVIQAWKSAG